jgi:hypothetical protein
MEISLPIPEFIPGTGYQLFLQREYGENFQKIRDILIELFIFSRILKIKCIHSNIFKDE